MSELYLDIDLGKEKQSGLLFFFSFQMQSLDCSYF